MPFPVSYFNKTAIGGDRSDVLRDMSSIASFGVIDNADFHIM